MILEALNLAGLPLLGLVAMAVAILLGVLAPALCSGVGNCLGLMLAMVLLSAALEGWLRLLGMSSLVRVLTCVCVPFTFGILIGTLIQLLRYSLGR